MTDEHGQDEVLCEKSVQPAVNTINARQSLELNKS